MQGLARNDFKAILHKLLVLGEGSAFQDLASPICNIVEQGVPYMPEMNPDLVCTACFQAAFNQAYITETFDHLVMGL